MRMEHPHPNIQQSQISLMDLLCAQPAILQKIPSHKPEKIRCFAEVFYAPHSKNLIQQAEPGIRNITVLCVANYISSHPVPKLFR